MNKIFLVFLFALTFIFSACQQELAEYIGDDSSVAAEFVAVTESYGDNTKTSLGESGTVVWTKNDQIAVFNREGYIGNKVINR